MALALLDAAYAAMSMHESLRELCISFSKTAVLAASVLFDIYIWLVSKMLDSWKEEKR